MIEKVFSREKSKLCLLALTSAFVTASFAAEAPPGDTPSMGLEQRRHRAEKLRPRLEELTARFEARALLHRVPGREARLLGRYLPRARVVAVDIPAEAEGLVSCRASCAMKGDTRRLRQCPWLRTTRGHAYHIGHDVAFKIVPK